MQSLVFSGLESTYSLYPSFSKLLCLLEVEEASKARGRAHDHTHSLDFLQDWQRRLPHLNADFRFVEPVLALRASILRCLLLVVTTDVNSEGGISVEGQKRMQGVVKALSETLFAQSRCAREAANFQVKYVYSLSLHTHTHTHTHTLTLHVNTHTHIYYTYIHTYTLHVHTFTHIHYMFTHTHTHTHTICSHMHIHTLHVHTYTYPHTLQVHTHHT